MVNPARDVGYLTVGCEEKVVTLDPGRAGASVPRLGP